MKKCCLILIAILCILTLSACFGRENPGKIQIGLKDENGDFYPLASNEIAYDTSGQGDIRVNFEKDGETVAYVYNSNTETFERAASEPDTVAPNKYYAVKEGVFLNIYTADNELYFPIDLREHDLYGSDGVSKAYYEFSSTQKYLSVTNQIDCDSQTVFDLDSKEKIQLPISAIQLYWNKEDTQCILTEFYTYDKYFFDVRTGRQAFLQDKKGGKLSWSLAGKYICDKSSSKIRLFDTVKLDWTTVDIGIEPQNYVNSAGVENANIFWADSDDCFYVIGTKQIDSLNPLHMGGYSTEYYISKSVRSSWGFQTKKIHLAQRQYEYSFCLSRNFEAIFYIDKEDEALILYEMPLNF